MVIDKNKPLPPHTKLDYWECYAKFVLEELLPEKTGIYNKQTFISLCREYEKSIKYLADFELYCHYDKKFLELPKRTGKIPREYDEIIGSIHNLRGMPDFYDFKSFDGFVIEELMEEYFDELTEMLQWGNFDVLAHITYPFRYIFNLCGYIEDISKYSRKVDELLKLCAEKDKALEINMGGLKYPINKPSPDIETVKRYKELGGKLISVGSDSHYAERIGFGIPGAYEIALEAGFKSIAVFENRRPQEIAIR